MGNSFEKLQKDKISALHILSQGLALGAKSVTTTTKTIEKGNDLDSARHIESSASILTGSGVIDE